MSVLFLPLNFWESSLICWDHVWWVRNKLVQLGLIHLRYLQFGTMKVKVKFTLEQVTKAQRGSRGITTLSLTSALDGVDGQRHVPAALPLGKRPGTHCIGGWMGPRAGLEGCGKSHPTGIRSQDRPARSESLYHLRYPGPLFGTVPITKACTGPVSICCKGKGAWCVTEPFHFTIVPSSVYPVLGGNCIHKRRNLHGHELMLVKLTNCDSAGCCVV